MAEPFSLKDQLFNQAKVAYLAGLLAQADADFDAVAFERDVMADLPSLELKQRIDLITRILADHLPDDYLAAMAVILRALPPELDPKKTDDDFGDFIFAPFGEFVAVYGLEPMHLGLSLEALKELTKRFSMEFALRHFLNTHQAEVMDVLATWVGDENYHVRRLVSEGTRPRLPWGVKVGLDVSQPVSFLDQLHSDTTRYVTRSVANHLNDIAKIDAGLVVGTLEKWHGQRKQTGEELDWMTRHALRSLVKRGDKPALALLGYHTPAPIQVGAISFENETIARGDCLEFSVDIQASEETRLMVDYAVHFVKADGKQKPKVFKLKQLGLKAGQTVRLEKRHRFKADATTFRLYPGDHKLELLINGVSQGSVDFTLV